MRKRWSNDQHDGRARLHGADDRIHRAGDGGGRYEHDIDDEHDEHHRDDNLKYGLEHGWFVGDAVDWWCLKRG